MKKKTTAIVRMIVVGTIVCVRVYARSKTTTHVSKLSEVYSTNSQ